MASPRTVLELRVGSLAEDAVHVSRVRGWERLSQLFSFEVDFAHRDGEPVDLESLRGAEAVLALRRPGGAERLVHGIAWAAELTGVAAGKPSYRVRIGPGLERLRHRAGSRIFQGESVPDVVSKVLDDGGVKHRLSLQGSRAPREYCVQYRETDLAFVSRLLEDEGIFHRFEHGTDADELVLADAAGGPELPDGATVPFRAGQGAGDSAEDEHLFRLERFGRARSTQVTLRDFDFLQPAAPVEAESEARPDAALPWYEFPGGFTAAGEGRRRATLRLEELRYGGEAFTGEGTCLRFVPGVTFEVAGHPAPGFDRKLLLVEVEHHAEQQASAGAAGGEVHGYRNVFWAVDASVPYRPRRATPRPRAAAETAAVVATSGEEILVDARGRVKVRFHWDRSGSADDSASCWLRVAQPWAGPGWGAQFLPRAGQEVLVRFLEGDPDRPLVLGAIYNGGNPTPIALPGDKTKSTLRSDSSLGGGGSNELRFEDRKDAEEVHLHAQKDHLVAVENDEARTIASNAALDVAKDRSIAVKGAQRLELAGNDTAQVTRNQTLSVSGDRTTTVASGHTEKVTVAQTVTVSGNRNVTVATAVAETVLGAEALNVGGAYAVTVAGAVNVAVGGLHAIQVGGAAEELVGAMRELQVKGDSSAKAGGSHESTVKGGVTFETAGDQKEQVDGAAQAEAKKELGWEAKDIRLEAQSKLSVIVNGKLALAMDSGGNVTFGASAFEVDASGTLTFKGSSVKLDAAGTPPSGSSSVKQLASEENPRAVVAFTVADSDGNPVANEPFRVELPDGTVKSGRTDASGGAKVPGSKEGNAKVYFPRIDPGGLKKG
jgi:type VI secretion system secreted protein VgrG